MRHAPGIGMADSEKSSEKRLASWASLAFGSIMATALTGQRCLQVDLTNLTPFQHVQTTHSLYYIACTFSFAAIYPFLIRWINAPKLTNAFILLQWQQFCKLTTLAG